MGLWGTSNLNFVASKQNRANFYAHWVPSERYDLNQLRYLPYILNNLLKESRSVAWSIESNCNCYSTFKLLILHHKTEFKAFHPLYVQSCLLSICLIAVGGNRSKPILKWSPRSNPHISANIHWWNYITYCRYWELSVLHKGTNPH